MAANVKFTQAAAEKIVTAVEKVLGEPFDNSGNRSVRRTYYNTDCTVQIFGPEEGTPPAAAQYQANVLELIPTDAVGTDFAGPTGMQPVVTPYGTSNGYNAVACNLDESGLPGNRLMSCTVPGKLMFMDTTGRYVVFIEGGRGTKPYEGSGESIGQGSTSLPWDRDLTTAGPGGSYTGLIFNVADVALSTSGPGVIGITGNQVGIDATGKVANVKGPNAVSSSVNLGTGYTATFSIYDHSNTLRTIVIANGQITTTT